MDDFSARKIKRIDRYGVQNYCETIYNRCNMKMQIFVIMLNVVRPGYLKKIDLKNGMKIKEKQIGVK